MLSKREVFWYEKILNYFVDLANFFTVSILGEWKKIEHKVTCQYTVSILEKNSLSPKEGYRALKQETALLEVEYVTPNGNIDRFCDVSIVQSTLV